VYNDSNIKINLIKGNRINKGTGVITKHFKEYTFLAKLDPTTEYNSEMPLLESMYGTIRHVIMTSLNYISPFFENMPEVKAGNLLPQVFTRISQNTILKPFCLSNYSLARSQRSYL
jgi:hypothetical protein